MPDDFVFVKRFQGRLWLHAGSHFSGLSTQSCQAHLEPCRQHRAVSDKDKPSFCLQIFCSCGQRADTRRDLERVSGRVKPSLQQGCQDRIIAAFQHVTHLRLPDADS